MLTELNNKLENLGEGLRGSIKYDFTYEFDVLEFFKTKFKKDRLTTNLIHKTLHKKIT